MSTPLSTTLDDFLTAKLVGTPASARPLRPAVFVDLDGTLIEPLPADLADPTPVRFIPGAGEALARLRAAGLAVVIVTNQSGIARGYFSRAQFARLQDVLERQLQDEFGAEIDDVAVCPHSPDARGRPACLCRKPAPGMLTRAARAHGLDLHRSWMIGDTLDDVEAGHRAGARSVLLDTGGETEWRLSPLREPDGRFTDWEALVDQLLASIDPLPARPVTALASAQAPVLTVATAASRLIDASDEARASVSSSSTLFAAFRPRPAALRSSVPSPL